MPVTLTDVEIAKLMGERKPLSSTYRRRCTLKPKRGHKEAEMGVKGDDGSEFRVIFRQSIANPLDFSVILGYCDPRSNQIFRVRRYNGRSHQHTNKIEGDTFYAFHIYSATERYQDSGLSEDAYGESTHRYSDYHGAVECLFNDYGFVRPKEDELPLFDPKR